MHICAHRLESTLARCSIARLATARCSMLDCSIGYSPFCFQPAHKHRCRNNDGPFAMSIDHPMSTGKLCTRLCLHRVCKHSTNPQLALPWSFA